MSALSTFWPPSPRTGEHRTEAEAEAEETEEDCCLRLHRTAERRVTRRERVQVQLSFPPFPSHTILPGVEDREGGGGLEAGGGGGGSVGPGASCSPPSPRPIPASRQARQAGEFWEVEAAATEGRTNAGRGGGGGGGGRQEEVCGDGIGDGGGGGGGGGSSVARLSGNGKKREGRGGGPKYRPGKKEEEGEWDWLRVLRMILCYGAPYVVGVGLPSPLLLFFPTQLTTLPPRISVVGGTATTKKERGRTLGFSK